MAERSAPSPYDDTIADDSAQGGPALDPSLALRYEERGAIGRGGMGEVLLCRDRRFGREVALKRTRGASPTALARFLREGRVQAQLEHPSIVPVYDLALGGDGRAHLAMKRVVGRTLADVIDGLRRGDAALAAELPLHRLLGAFCQVCLALEYAHEKGVVHRDLKPANVMLGEFGEVMVLDWGLCRVLAEPGDDAPLDAEPLRRDRTAAGQLLGTPGYMAPEQVACEPADRRADVWALGAILFEILTLEPLVPEGDVNAMLAATIAPLDARARVRAPTREVPEELERACAKATRLDPLERYATARELCEAVQGHLQRTQDRTWRNERASEHATRAEVALAGGHSEDAARELRSALALAPEHEAAQRVLVRWLLEPPQHLPRDAERELAERRERDRRVAIRGAIVGQALVLATAVAGALWLGVRTPRAMLGLLAVAVLMLLVILHNRNRPTPRYMRLVVVLVGCFVAMTTGAVGPLVLAPEVAFAYGTVLLISNRSDERTARWVVPTMVAAIVVPLVLEWLDLLPPSYAVEDDRLLIVPRLVELAPTPTLVVLALAALATLATAVALLGRWVDAFARAERDRAAHAWRIEQLVPEAVRAIDEERPERHRAGK